MDRRVRQEVKAMTRSEVIVRAIAKEITWIQAAWICGITDRHMRRLKEGYLERGFDGLVDHRGGRSRRKRIAVETLEEVCSLKRERYADFSVQHFWEKVREEHKIAIGYTWLKLALQAAGLAEKSPGRGRYRRRRERRAMRGMLVHLDASTHQWIAGEPMQDLMVALDDADGRMLYAQFVPQEGTLSTFAALKHILRRLGRFAELYTDRGSHFCHTPTAGAAPTTAHAGQVSRALKVLGIRQLLAWSPQARGRSERAFQTIQGRLPQELRAAGIGTYADANEYLDKHFLPDFNRRFTVEPAQAESAFVPLVGVDLDLLLSVQHQRSVNNDSTVAFEGLSLQLPRTAERAHYVRCEVTVHEFPEGTLGVSYQGRLLARYDRDGQLLAVPAPRPAAARNPQQIGTTRPLSGIPIVRPGASERVSPAANGRRAQSVRNSAARAGRATRRRVQPAATQAGFPARGSSCPQWGRGHPEPVTACPPLRRRALPPATMWTAASAITQRRSTTRRQEHRKKRAKRPRSSPSN
ncbi:MAG: transposase [Deltaproteobacteria bacterium]|nr:transposase [Deltaproteobacteria bacterium]